MTWIRLWRGQRSTRLHAWLSVEWERRRKKKPWSSQSLLSHLSTSILYGWPFPLTSGCFTFCFEVVTKQVSKLSILPSCMWAYLGVCCWGPHKKAQILAERCRIDLSFFPEKIFSWQWEDALLKQVRVYEVHVNGDQCTQGSSNCFFPPPNKKLKTNLRFWRNLLTSFYVRRVLQQT